MGFDINFLLVLISALGIGFIFSFATKDAIYYGQNTDNELMVYAAAQSDKWKWFSDLHKYARGKTGMKDLTVILISFFQKILRNKEAEHSYLTLGGFSNSFSAIFIYLIASAYWGPGVGMFVSILFLTSVWNWQTALYGGHGNVAMMIFLASVFFLQQSDSGMLMSSWWWVFCSGVIFCFAQFASASSIKYSPLYLAAAAFLGSPELFHNGYRIVIDKIASGSFLTFNLSLVFGFLFVRTIIQLTYKKIVSDMYYNRSVSYLNGMIHSRDKFPVEHYQEHAKSKIGLYTKLTSCILVLIFLLVNFAGLENSLAIITGFFTGFLILTLPDIKKSFKYYYNFLLETQIRKKSHFKGYVEFFAKRGIIVSRYTQGAGIKWVPKMLFRMIPVHTLIFGSAMIGSLILVLISSSPALQLANTLVILFISLSPIIWAELSRAPQLSRTYSPGLVGILIFIGYFSAKTEIYPFSYALGYLLISAAIIWNLWIFLSDVFPARMGPAELVKTLDSLGIKEFYTYNTTYNDAFIGGIPGMATSSYLPEKNILPPYRVHYINSVREVKNGWIVIPGTSSKALTMNTSEEALREDHYDKDPVLNELIATREIEKIAAAKFKTMANSRIWPIESEVTGFRDLILHDIKDEDRYRGYAWLLHSGKLRFKI